MRITRFTHSCVLVETPDRVGLFDPGNFSWQSGGFDLSKIDRIDRIAITHKHADHLDKDFLSAVLKKFPSAHIICNPDVETSLRSFGLDATYRGIETTCLKPFDAPHEDISVFGGQTPVNTGFHFMDEFTFPGDSLSFSITKKVLALPITAPWGSPVEAMKLALKLKPQFILPIHDWHYQPQARAGIYDMFEAELKKHEITFLKVVDGQTITL